MAGDLYAYQIYVDKNIAELVTSAYCMRLW